MSHFSDVGLSDLEDMFHYECFMNSLLAGDFGAPTIVKTGGGKSLHIYSTGAIYFIFPVDDATDKVVEFELGYKNERLTLCKNVRFARKIVETEFRTIRAETENIPFWFDCLNAPLYDLKEEDEDGGIGCRLAVSSFVNDIKIVDEAELFSSEHSELAAESYIANEYPCNGFVSGIIKAFSLEQNPFTEEKYYVIDVDCLGVHFRLLADPERISGKSLKVGRIARGNCWNTAFIV